MDGRAFGMEGWQRVCDDCKRAESTVLQQHGVGLGLGRSHNSNNNPAALDAAQVLEGADGFMRNRRASVSGPVDLFRSVVGGVGGGGAGAALPLRAESSITASSTPAASSVTPSQPTDGATTAAGVGAAAGAAGGPGSSAAAATSNASAASLPSAQPQPQPQPQPRYHYNPDTDFAGGGGGLSVFDDRARLAQPVGPLFNLPATSQAELLLRALCAAADAHLDWLVRRAVGLYIPEGPAQPGAPRVPVSSISLGAAASAPEGQLTIGTAQAEWAAVILRLARRAVAMVDPNIRAGDRAAVRMYVKIKAVPLPAEAAVSRPEVAGTPVVTPRPNENDIHGGVENGDGLLDGLGPVLPAATAPVPPVSLAPAPSGRVGPCEIISGVMFRRSLPHKSMRHDIGQPAVLLIDGSILYFRSLLMCYVVLG